MRRTIPNQFESYAHGSIRFAAQGLGWTLVHANDFTGVLDMQTRTIGRWHTGAELFDQGSLADKDQL